MNTRNFYIFMLMIFSVLLQGCSSALSTAAQNRRFDCSQYMEGNSTELTYGPMYQKKYWNSFTGVGECVKLNGYPIGLSTTVLGDGEPYIILGLKVKADNAPNGKQFPVLADVSFDKKLRELKTDKEITVYGRVMGMGGSSLGLMLKKFEVSP